MDNHDQRSFLSVTKECLALFWAFTRGKNIRMADGRDYRPELSQRSRLFDRIGRLVLFAPEDMGCYWDFHMVPGDRRFRLADYGATATATGTIHDNQTRVRVRELLSKKAAKYGVVVVLLGAFIAPRFVQHMTPFHVFSGTAASSIGAAVRHF